MQNLDSVRAALWPNYAPPGLLFTHGEGSLLYTEDGTAYLDFLSGIAVNSFGHVHPYLLKALQEQAQQLWHISNLFRISAGEILAQRLCALSFADRVFFSNSGTEAVEAAIKAVRGYHARQGNPQRNRIICFSNSFHGRTLAAIAAAGNVAHMQDFIVGDNGFDHVEWENLDELEKAISGNSAGIMLEPVQGEGGIRPASPGFIEFVRELCDNNGLLLVFDEVQCGIGRTGKLFAYENYGVKPDVMALAKGLGGGFPVGACLTTDVVAQAMGVGTHGSTFGGNPLAMVVANAVLDLVLEDDLLMDVQRKGQRLMKSLGNLVDTFPEIISKVSGMGLMIGVDCVVPNGDLVDKLRDNHLIVGKAGGNTIRLLPPLNVSDAHIDECLATFEKTLLAMSSE